MIEAYISDHRAISLSIIKLSEKNWLQTGCKEIINYDYLITNSLLLEHEWSNRSFSNDVEFQFQTF